MFEDIKNRIPLVEVMAANVNIAMFKDNILPYNNILLYYMRTSDLHLYIYIQLSILPVNVVFIYFYIFLIENLKFSHK